ncbi:hypothetical protein QQF64_032368 [Cirrhinus molitorella]|uniref:Prolactin receptor n=1 Tax=Cirrhinus molitorella TaxID=172907 RepID=A0ABR3MZM3_9TELE
MPDESVCPRSVVDLKDSGDELMANKCPRSSHPSDLQDISLASHVLLPWRYAINRGLSTSAAHPLTSSKWPPIQSRSESPDALAQKSAQRRGVT